MLAVKDGLNQGIIILNSDDIKAKLSSNYIKIYLK